MRNIAFHDTHTAESPVDLYQVPSGPKHQIMIAHQPMSAHKTPSQVYCPCKLRENSPSIQCKLRQNSPKFFVHVLKLWTAIPSPNELLVLTLAYYEFMLNICHTPILLK